MRQVTSSFTDDLKEFAVEGENASGKRVSLGKILSQQWNCGIALIDISKVDKLGGNTKYFIGDKRAIIWQPTWLDMERKRNNNQSDEKPEL